ncbi:putative caspase-like protein [Bradyrhizobium sp. LM6.11]
MIGNSAYKSAPKLGNPVNDATLVGGMFKKAGFDSVDVRLDLSASEMRRMLREFAGRTRDADVAVIYYAGHGIELEGTNYLIPTDATLETDGDVLDETIPVERALFAVEPAKQLRLIILDACRDNPFSKTMKRTLASRAIGRGLAKVEPTSPNTMIAFAAKAGSTASDGDSKNSPFAVALVEHLPKPGLDLRKAFGFVRDDVLKSTGYKQEPYVYGSLGGDDVPLVAVKPAASGAQANPQDSIRRDYELALQLATRDGWEAFLAQYPEGFYANLAKGQMNKIAAEETRASAEQKANAAEQQKARLIAERAQKTEQDKAAAAAQSCRRGPDRGGEAEADRAG